MDKEKNGDGLRVEIPTSYYSSLRTRYEIYILCCNDGNGYDKITGEKLKTFDEWLDS